MPQTTIYSAAKIITMNPNQPEVSHVAVREGRIETAVYLRSAVDGETLFHRLLTDGFAMSIFSGWQSVWSSCPLPRCPKMLFWPH